MPNLLNGGIAVQLEQKDAIKTVPRSDMYGAYLEQRRYTDGPLGLLLRAVDRARDGTTGSSLADIRTYEAARAGRDWASSTARLLLAECALFSDDTRDYPDGNLSELTSYPNYARYRLLPSVSCLPARQEKARGAVAALSVDAAILSDTNLAHSITVLATNGHGDGPQIFGFLSIVALEAGTALACEAAEQAFERTAATNAARRAILAFLRKVGDLERARKLALAASGRERCDWSILYLCDAAMREGATGIALRTLDHLVTANASVRDQAAKLRAKIELDVAERRLSQALPRDRLSRLNELITQIECHNKYLPPTRIMSAILGGMKLAVDIEALEEFEKLLSHNYLDNASAAETCAEALLSLQSLLQSSTENTSLGCVLKAEMKRRRSQGRPRSAYMFWLLSAKASPIRDQDRLDGAYLALSLGRFGEALRAMRGVSRLERHQILEVNWPTDMSGVPWPLAPVLPAACIPSLLPEGFEWPRISIVVPSFNQSKYVRECLNSIKAQQYPNLEVIIYDAGSTDGTIEILEEYRTNFSSITIEPDRGQSDAINKGLARSTGELLHWLNTDDMLAPQACFAAALTYLQSNADVIAGACIEISDREMLLLNLPSASSADFQDVELCRQFDRWLRGNFFYQPEVFFTRRIWEATGGQLDPDHNFAMDFHLWLRCAQAGAVYERVAWPISFFRKHDEQKTSLLEDTIDEQANMINELLPQKPNKERDRAVRRLLLAPTLKGKKRRVAVVSKRFEKIFSASIFDDIYQYTQDIGKITIYSSPADIPIASTDQIIFLAHALVDYDDAHSIRESGFDGPIIMWFWDNHHNYFENRKSAETADFIVPGHAFCKNYLMNSHSIMGFPVPLCVTQWGKREAIALFAQHGLSGRLDDILGGFVEYRSGMRRNRLIEDLIGDGLSEHIYIMPEDRANRYFGMDGESRFAHWCQFKTSLCLPLRGDLSQRFFDAWLTGQIPVVPSDFPDLHHFIDAKEIQDHVVMFKAWDVASVSSAHRDAVAKFDSQGQIGINARHELALKHCLVDRLRTIIAAGDTAGKSLSISGSDDFWLI